MKFLSHVQLFASPWTVAYQAPPSMGFSRQGYWSGLPYPSPEDLPDPGIEPGFPTLQIGVKLICPHVRQSQCACHEWLRALTDVKKLQYLLQRKWPGGLAASE